MAEQEVLFGSKPSPVNLQIGKKGPKLSHGGGGSSKKPSTPQTPKTDPFRSIKAKKSDSLQPNEQLNHPRDDAFVALSAGKFRPTLLFLRLRRQSFKVVLFYERLFKRFQSFLPVRN